MSNSSSTALSLASVLDPAYAANPYPLYHRLRLKAPVYWDPSLAAWVLTRYSDIMAALHDSRLSAQRAIVDAAWFPSAAQNLVAPPICTIAKQMIFRDPPDHKHVRGPWAKAFTPRSAEELRARIQQQVDRLLDIVQANRRMNVVSDLAQPLAESVIVALLGLPPEDRHRFGPWAASYAQMLDGKVQTRKGMAQVLRGVAELTTYLLQLIDQRRTTPKDGLLQSLITPATEGGTYDEDNVIANCILFLIAGYDSTTHLLDTGLLILLQHPDQLHELKQDPSLIPAAVLEILRYDSPVQAAVRRAREDIEIGGQLISAGQTVLMCLGAANRDPARFSDPDRFDLHRRENRPLSFGHGIHVCPGVPLVRLQAEIALNTILRRFDILRLETAALEWEVGLSSRVLKALPIVCA